MSSGRLEDVGYNDAIIRLLDTGVYSGLDCDRGSTSGKVVYRQSDSLDQS